MIEVLRRAWRSSPRRSFVAIPSAAIAYMSSFVAGLPHAAVGHLVFLCGLVALTRSPLALAGLAIQAIRFRNRVVLDERRLADRFGNPYVSTTSSMCRVGCGGPAFLRSGRSRSLASPDHTCG